MLWVLSPQSPQQQHLSALSTLHVAVLVWDLQAHAQLVLLPHSPYKGQQLLLLGPISVWIHIFSTALHIWAYLLLIRSCAVIPTTKRAEVLTLWVPYGVDKSWDRVAGIFLFSTPVKEMRL